ncbi:MAG: glycosyltransferase family 4 protein [Deltaproteobacteria bacterium]|nr:glycosyltransferase family 4 protein [Deltaproteobacteria bacterium]
MKKQPIRLAVLLQDLEFGGTQRYAVNLLKHLNRERFLPELWLLRGGDHMRPLAEDAGIKIVRFSESLEVVTPFAVFRLLFHILRSRPRILYTLTVVPNIWGRVWGRLARVPAIVSGSRNVIAEPFEKYLWRLSTRIICNAEAGRDFLVREFGTDPERIAVIPNAVDTEHFAPNNVRKAPDPTILYVGRLEEQKNPLNLLKAFRLVKNEVPDARLIIMGNGRLRSGLQQFIRSHSLDESVQMLPGRMDAAAYFRSAWVFALASRYEGSPNVVIEAMSSGLPVAATRVGGVPELVQHRKTGLLVEPNDCRSLKTALATLLTDEAQRKAMGRKSREVALDLHSLKKMARDTEHVLWDAALDVGKKSRP